MKFYLFSNNFFKIMWLREFQRRNNRLVQAE